MQRHGVPYTRFPAIDGRALSAAHTRALSDPALGIIRPTASMIGCGASHRAVWRDVLAKGHGLALVLEDDAVLCPDFMHRVQEALVAVPRTFDVLVLGSFLLSDANRDYPWALDIAGAFLATRDDPWTATVGSTTVFVPELFAGTHCYIISAAGAAKLLRVIPRVKNHVDVEMNNPDIVLYAASPDLAKQSDMSTSSIASFDFPKVLLPFLEWKDRKGVCAAYYMDTPIGQVGGCRINTWVLLFLAIGLLAPSSTWPYVAGFLGAEVLAHGTELTYNSLVPPGAYVLGFSIRRQLFSMR